jgi:hypothetical protein
VAAILSLRNEEEGWELKLSAYLAVAVAMLLAGCGARDAPVEQAEQDATVAEAARSSSTSLPPPPVVGGSVFVVLRVPGYVPRSVLHREGHRIPADDASLDAAIMTRDAIERAARRSK